MAVAIAAQWVSLFLLKSLAISFVLYTLGCCIVLPLALAWAGSARERAAGGALERLGLRPFGLREALIGLGSGVAIGGIIVASFFVAGEAFLAGSDPDRVVGLWGITPGPIAYLYAAGLILNGAAEELFWRAHLSSTLAGARPRWLAVGLPALVFGAQHIFVMSALVTNPAALAVMMAGITAAGFLWAILYDRFKRLSMTIMSHALAAVAYIGVLFVYVLR